MLDKGFIKAVQSLLMGFKPVKGKHPAEELAIKRFSAKLEVPDRSTHLTREKRAWQEWIDNDPTDEFTVYGPNWAKAKMLCSQWLDGFSLSDTVFTNGSQFAPSLGLNSIEMKLQEGDWTVTPDCFDLFLETVLSTRALKVALKQRWLGWCRQRRIKVPDANKRLYALFKGAKPIMAFKLRCVCILVQGNRWGVVPKNNLEDRPICLEPFGNMLVQRRIGEGIRRCLRDNAACDLRNAAQLQQLRISDPQVATIDLKSASDRISMRLVEYLLPRRVFRLIKNARSCMTLGPDGMYYIINKVSSMGNGFTFDLMSLLLLAICRVNDKSASVYGDDIIVANSVALSVITDLQAGGFVINRNKTLIDSPYRESCGAHFIDGYGYVCSFDIRYPLTMCDCVVICNKVAILAHVYPEIFSGLCESIRSVTPPSLHGRVCKGIQVSQGRPQQFELDRFIRWFPGGTGIPLSKRVRRRIVNICRDLQIRWDSIVAVPAFEEAPNIVNRSLKSTDWGRYYQYLYAGRCSVGLRSNVLKPTYVVEIGTRDELLSILTRCYQ